MNLRTQAAWIVGAELRSDAHPVSNHPVYSPTWSWVNTWRKPSSGGIAN